jgi:hypothetical protein
MLKEDQRFKLISRYIIPVDKMLSTIAIYNDMGFLQSIGQVTADNPGMYVEELADGTIDYSGSTAGWEKHDIRKPGFFSGWGIREWDNWDRQLLRNCKGRMKSLFRTYYNSRDFETNFESMFQFDPVEFSISEIKEKIKPNIAESILPSWRRSGFRTNPFDSNGTLCEK